MTVQTVQAEASVYVSILVYRKGERKEEREKEGEEKRIERDREEERRPCVCV